MHIQTDFDRPIIFRTVDEQVYQNTLQNGSLWLRSNQYYQRIEDQARKDVSEGVNGTRTLLPLRFATESGASFAVEGPGSIGCEIVPHYILSMHGTSISEECHRQFGGFTLGIKCIARLSAEILYQASKQLDVFSYRFGQVAYQYTALSRSYNTSGAAIGIGGSPPVAVRSINTDVLRKEPVEPFISQDEWRIVTFPERYLDNDPDRPLKINVSPDHFFEYMQPSNKRGAA
jgi:hypothetical protein